MKETSLKYSISDIAQVAEKVIAFLDEYNIVLLKGDLGAGKTTLTKEILRQLGVKEEVTSPTYTLVNEYDLESSIVYHMDLYRLEHVEEALEIGLEDMLDSPSICLIEWPGIIEELLPSKVITLHISHLNPDERLLRIS